MPQHILLNESLWVYGQAIVQGTRNAQPEIDALAPRGAATFMLKSGRDKDGLEELRRLIWQSDRHVILTRLFPAELSAIKPILSERKHFSVIYDDWWTMPHWFTCHAEYVIFRKYNGVAIRLGKAGWMQDSPPWLFNPLNGLSKYSLIAAALRLPVLAASPAVAAANHFRRQRERIAPGRYLYMPYAVVAGDLPLAPKVQYKYDFANTGGVAGIWLIRDPFAPFHHTFTNLYHDRLRLARMIASFRGQPFAVYDNRGKYVTWDEYVQLSRQSRYVVSTGGLQDTLGPKHLEYACLGIPMIGRDVPFEAPWLSDCLFSVDVMRLRRAQLKPLLEEALARQPGLHENCLAWRSRLLQLHAPHTILDMLQAQIDGQPIPAGYLKVDLKNPSVGRSLAA